MNSLQSIRADLITRMQQAIAAYNAQESANVAIAYENQPVVDYNNLSLYCSVIFSASSNERLGKEDNPRELDEGFFQINTYSNQNTNYADLKQNDLIDFLRGQFRNKIGNTTIVSRDVETLGAVDGRYVKVITVNWIKEG